MTYDHAVLQRTTSKLLPNMYMYYVFFVYNVLPRSSRLLVNERMKSIKYTDIYE